MSVPFVETGSYPTRAGGRVIPWIDGEPAFRRICEAIELARETVWATVTFMWPSFRMPRRSRYGGWTCSMTAAVGQPGDQHCARIVGAYTTHHGNSTWSYGT